MTAISIRPASPADVAAMVAEIAALEDQAAHVHVDEDQWAGLLGRYRRNLAKSPVRARRRLRSISLSPEAFPQE